jgi:hypothetical protein
MNHPTFCRITNVSFLVLICTASCLGFEDQKLSQGQTVYVSVYSNIFTAPRAIPFSLEATLVIRNTDMSESLRVTTIDFYDTEGKLVKRFVETPLVLQPLETKYIYLPGKNAAGGLGANFVVRWTAAREINAPIVECLMIGTKSGQGISFISAGKAIKEHAR